jgi:hypothetical protein
VSASEARQIAEDVNRINLQLSPAVQPPGGQEAQSFEFRGRRLVHQLATEKGIWTPGFSLNRAGYAEVDVTNNKGYYWLLGKCWEIEGWFTVTLPSSATTGLAELLGMPFGLGSGNGQISIECEALDGSIQVANNLNLKGISVVPFSIDLLPHQAYNFHIVADYESD